MLVYWFLKSIPELAPFTEQQRRQIVKDCTADELKQSNRNWRIVLSRFTTIIPMMALPFLSPSFVPLPILVVALAAVGEAYMYQRWLGRIVTEIRRHVGGYCVACGYDIRASGETCPECGVTLSGNRPAI